MLDIVSYCAVVTLSLRRAVFTIFDLKNDVTLKSGQMSLKVIESNTIRKIVYGFLLLFFGNIVPKTHRFEIFDFKTVVTLKTGLGVSQGHWKFHLAIERI